MTDPTPLLVVLGATGHQGSSVLRHFTSQANPRFRLRGLTRNPDSAASKSLSAQGIEMVRADLDDPASLTAAFADATHIFANTDSNQLMFDKLMENEPGVSAPEYATGIERGHGRNVARAAAATGSLRRIVWSGLASPKRWSRGKYTLAAMFDAKEDIEGYLAGEEGLAGKLSVLLLGFYANNAARQSLLYAPKKQRDGVYELALPMAGDVPVPIADVEADAGRWVEALFQAPAGIKLVGASEDMTWKQWLDVWGEHNQVATRYRELPPEDFPPELKAITEPMVQVFKFVEEFGYTGGDPEALRIDDLRHRGVSVETSNVVDHIRRTDWSHVL